MISVQSLRGVASALALAVLLVLPVLSHGQGVNGGKAWKQKTVSIDMEDAEPSSLITRIADLTGQSLLVEGMPINKRVTLKTTDTADKVLTTLCDELDYEWTVSKSGIVLLHKRFTNRDDLPEFDAAEMQAVCRDVLEAVRVAYPAAESVKDYNDLYPSLLRALGPEQFGALKSGARLSVGNMPPEAQRLAAQVIYAQLLERVFRQWSIFQNSLQNLPRTNIERCLAPFYIGSRAVSAWYVLVAAPGDESGYNRIVLSQTEVEPNSGPQDIPAAPLQAPDKSFRPSAESPDETGARSLDAPAHNGVVSLGLCTVGRVVDALRSSSDTKITLSPSIANRRLIAELRGATAAQTLSALAELHGWALTPTDAGNFILMRRSYQPPQNMVELGQVIQAALPTDMRRFLLAEPSPGQDENYRPESVPELKTWTNTIRVRAKLEELTQAEKRHLDAQVRDKARVKPIPYAAWTPAQRRQCERILALEVCFNTINNLTELITGLNIYQRNPQSADLSYGGNLLRLGNFGIIYDIDNMRPKVN